jgi:hypothetical protein
MASIPSSIVINGVVLTVLTESPDEIAIEMAATLELSTID